MCPLSGTVAEVVLPQEGSRAAASLELPPGGWLGLGLGAQRSALARWRRRHPGAGQWTRRGHKCCPCHSFLHDVSRLERNCGFCDF